MSDLGSEPFSQHMDALVDFVNARVAEDEQRHIPVADGTQSSWEWFQGSESASEQALRDVAAKRSHIARYQQVDDSIPGSTGIVRNELLSVRRAYALVLLDDATVYAGHPDYRAEWRPNADKGADRG